MNKMHKANRTDETRMQKCGMECTIIEYMGYHNITVQFTDGTIVEHKGYNNFVRGSIQNPNISSCLQQSYHNQRKQRIGETRMQNCGMECTIIEYHDFHNITVKFVDNTVLEHKEYDRFKAGNILNPNIGSRQISSILKHRKQHVGETRAQNCGMKCTIIKYTSWPDITVKFTDGTIIEHRTYGNFKNGQINNTNIDPDILRVAQRKLRINETHMQKCGMKCTIIKYIKADDITVQFTDGTIVEHKTYYSFVHGGIQNPKMVDHHMRIMLELQRQRIGETRMQNCSMECTITEYIRHDNITVRFIDGTTLKCKKYAEFARRSIQHPILTSFKYRKRFVHQTKTAKYYNATCKICGYNYILTPMQMIEHVKKFHPETLENYKGDE